MVDMDFEFIDFDTVKEDWSQYRLKDGSIIKIKYVLIKVKKYHQLDKFGNPVYDLNSHSVIGLIPNKALLGKPSAPTSLEKLVKSIVDKDMQFETIAEPWNEYKLKDGTMLRVKLVLTIISRTDKFDERGEPIYIINTQPIAKSVR